MQCSSFRRCLMVGLIVCALIRAADESDPRLLTHVARQAKAGGNKSVLLKTSVGVPLSVKSLDDLLRVETVLLGMPVASQVVVTYGQTLTTWYKFKILKRLSTALRVGPAFVSSLRPEDTPVNLLPLKADEVLVPRIGGTTVIDGVRITIETPAFPQFETAETYLLCGDETADKVLTLSLAQDAVFDVDTQRDRIRPWGSDDQPLAREIALQHGSLHNFSAALQLRTQK